MSAPTLVAMPRLSDSMEEGTVLRWIKEEGAEVARGDELVEIETDKATLTYEAEAAGVLRRLVAEGETVALGQPIAELITPGAPLTPVPARRNGGRVPASPVARRIAERLGVDLRSLVGTGPHGRIVKRDVEAAAPAVAEPPPPAPVPPGPLATAPPDGLKGPVEQFELMRVQTTVARRMAESRATVPDFAVEVDVVADELIALRERLRTAEPDAAPPSYNDFVVKACALALRAHPRVNGAYRDGRIEQYGRINVGVAVAADDALLVPVVTDADEKSIGTIAAETRRLAARARAGELSAAELSGGTFTVSNLGMFGIARFSAVINAPQAAILAVGALEERAIARGGRLRAARAMSLTLCADHRILYGADAAAFLAAVRAVLESPLRLLL